jgi:hypothetical protein
MVWRDLGIGSIIFRPDELGVSPPEVVRASEHANSGDGIPTNRPYRALQAAGITPARAGCNKRETILRLGRDVTSIRVSRKSAAIGSLFGFIPESGSFDPDRKLQAAWCRLRFKLPRRSEQLRA